MKFERSEIRALTEQARRNNDGLAMFRPLKTQEPFFEDTSSEVAIWGGNRSGKSTAAAAKFASVLRDFPITFRDGTVHDQRLPWQKDRALLMWVVGLQLNHIGQTIYRLLFKPGLYDIIRDRETRLWRSFDPEIDAGREKEKRPSFPLVPLKTTDANSWSWQLKSEKQFSSFEMKHDETQCYAFASTSDVKQGDPVDYIWIDERIAQDSHYDEWQARISDPKGRIVWSSMPRADSEAMLRLNQRAEDQAKEVEDGEREKADVSAYVLRFSNNPHIDDDEKRKRLEGWSKEVARQRDRGEFLTDVIKIYPTFNKVLCSAVCASEYDDDPLSAFLRLSGGEPGADWTRELILDPGTAKPGVLFGAIPPRKFWASADEPYFVVYDEVYEPRLDADALALACKSKVLDWVFHRFIIDGMAARQKPMSFSDTVGANYSKAFKKQGIRCTSTDFGFIPGDPNFEARSQIVESWVTMRKSGFPRLRVVVDRCPNLVWQMTNNLKKVTKGPTGLTIVEDKPAPGQKDDLRNCIEYWASRNPKWVEPVGGNKLLGGPGMRMKARIDAMFSKPKAKQSSTFSAGPGRCN